MAFEIQIEHEADSRPRRGTGLARTRLGACRPSCDVRLDLTTRGGFELYLDKRLEQAPLVFWTALPPFP